MRPLPIRRDLDRLLRNQTVRFLITGSGAALLFYLLTYAFIRSGATPFGGTLAAYALAFVTSYTIQHAWTFQGRQAHARSFPRYLAAQVAAALAASTTARLFGSLGATPALTALASTLVSGVLGYILSRYWVFAERGTARRGASAVHTSTACSSRPTLPNTRR